MTTDVNKSDQGVGALDRGKSGSEYTLWAIQEALKEAKICIQEQDKGRDTLTKTATTLAGWCTPLATVFAGVCFSDKFSLACKIASASVGVELGAAVFLCLAVIKTRNWKTDGTHPSNWYPVLNMWQDGYAEIDILAQKMSSMDNAVEQNSEKLEKMAAQVDWAWTAFTAFPAVGVLVLVIARIAI